MLKIAEVKLSSCGLQKKIAIAELRSCGCGATFLLKVAKVLPSSCGIAIADSLRVRTSDCSTFLRLGPVQLHICLQKTMGQLPRAIRERGFTLSDF